jgi:pyrophosphate--fructose-6-phosphate 1-phosphotransferase
LISAGKYYSFVRLMGRDASHLTLEVALRTQPNMVFISEEIYQLKKSLFEIVNEIVELVIKRHEEGKDYGIILVPEGLIQYIPEFSDLIEELNILLLKTEIKTTIIEGLTKKSSDLFTFLPESIQDALLGKRDQHGNVALVKKKINFLKIF